MYKIHSGVVTECTETQCFLPAGTKNLDRDTGRTALWHRSWDVSSGNSDLRSNCCSKSAEEFESGPSCASWVSYTWSYTIAGNLTSASVPSTYQECSRLHPAPQSLHHCLSHCLWRGGSSRGCLQEPGGHQGQSTALGWYMEGPKEGQALILLQRLNQYFCNSLLQQMGLALCSRLSPAKHSIQRACAAFRLQPS